MHGNEETVLEERGTVEECSAQTQSLGVRSRGQWD